MSEQAPSKALSNLLDAVQGVLAYSWDDNDPDAVEAVERLRTATDEYGVVQRLSHEPPAEPDQAEVARNFDSWVDSLRDPPQNYHQIFAAGYAAGRLDGGRR